MKYFQSLLLLLLIVGFFQSCKKESVSEKISARAVIVNDNEVPDSLRINQLQYIGSHNSYRLKTDPDILDYLFQWEALLGYNINELDYEHVTLDDQFSFYGVRQIELDIYADTDGGRFYNRKGNELVEKDASSGVSQLLEPGNKIIHIADIDYNTHYYKFTEALQAIKNWSAKYPYHLPIFVLIETKTETIANTVPGIGFAVSEPWDAQRLNSIEEEILSVFTTNNIITPDFVRGSYSTLNEAILNSGWPTVGETRGKVMFMFDQTYVTSTYKQGAPSLEGKLIFTNSTAGQPDGAFMTRNNVFSSSIEDLVSEGYLVRTRADSGTQEARTGDYSKLNKALQNGAHFISTDYYKPDPRHTTSAEWTNYSVQFENTTYKYNPITF